jgi:hypothetical protein
MVSQKIYWGSKTMKHTWKVAVAAAALVGTASIAKADLNLSGETGLILNPTAQIVQKGHPQIQANYYDFSSEYKDKIYGLYGAIQAADKLEISAGVDKFHSIDDYERSGFALGAKYQLLKQSDKGFDLAVGAGYDGGLQRNYHVYAAATKAFGSNSNRAPIEGTLGVRWDRFTLGGDSDHNSKTSVYAGVQVPVTRKGELSLIGEAQSKNIDEDAAKIPYALGVRYHPVNQSFSVSAGIQRQGFDTPYENSAKLFVQVGYTFGK